MHLYRPDEHRRWKDEKGRPISIVFITIRTIRGRLGLMPTKRNNELIVGVLGRAIERYDFEVYNFVTLTNHQHWAIGVRSAEHEARIKCYVHAQVAKEVGTHGHFGRYQQQPTAGKMWDTPAVATPVLDDLAAEDRFRYILANGTKEGLVAHPTQWPGVHGAKALCEGHRELHGVWYDRTELCKLRRQRGKQVPESEVARRYTVKLSKLPHLRHLSDEAYAQYCQELCDEIAAESRAALVAKHGPQFRPVGKRKLLDVDPMSYPKTPLEKRPAPLVHCSDRETREAYRAEYREFVEAYQEAHRRLRDAIRTGERTRIEFPHGGVPPAGLLTG